MSAHKDPTWHRVIARIFGDADEAADKDAPRVRVLANGCLEVDGVVFGRRDARRESPYRAPWSDAGTGESVL